MRATSTSAAFWTVVVSAAALLAFPARVATAGMVAGPRRVAVAARQTLAPFGTPGVAGSSKGICEVAQEARNATLPQALGDVNAMRLPAGAVRQAGAAPETSGSLWGCIVVEAGGRKRVIPVGEASSDIAAAKSRNLMGGTLLRRVSPLWERADGSPIAEDPSYRGRKFTEEGQLVGRAVDIAIRFDLMVQMPQRLHGMAVRVEIDELTVTTHNYRTSWGRVQSVDERPVEVGRLPSRTLAFRTGQPSGRRVVGLEKEGTYGSRPESDDVVRLAGCAFGLRCSYRIVVEGFAD